MKDDPRILRSKKQLLDSLLSLCRKKNIHDISVKELVNHAGLNRGTFYLHYQGMPDFWQKIMDEVLNGLLAYVQTPTSDKDDATSETPAYYTKYFSYIKQNSEIFQVMLGKNGLPEFRKKFADYGIQKYTKVISPYQQLIEDKISVPILVHYIISAHIGLVDYWLASGMKYSPEYMAEQLCTLTVQGPFRILDLKDIIFLPR